MKKILLITFFAVNLQAQTFQQKPMLGQQINRAHPLSRGLIGCWIFNEEGGNISNDISGNGNNGILVSMAQSDWISTKMGTALNFNGTTNYISVSPWGQLTGAAAKTIEAWFRTTSTSDFDILSWGSHATGALSTLGLYTGSGLGYLGFGGASQDVVVNPYSQYLDGEWRQIVFTYDGVVGRLYLDGILATSASRSYNVSNTVLEIARRPANSGQYFPGNIGLVRIYNLALSNSEIEWFYRKPYDIFEKEEPYLFVQQAPAAPVPQKKDHPRWWGLLDLGPSIVWWK